MLTAALKGCMYQYWAAARAFAMEGLLRLHLGARR